METPKNNLEFQEDGHIYTLNGRRLISVTQALSILDNRWKVDPFYLERGRMIHLATEYYDRDELDEDSVDPQIRPYFDGYLNFKRDSGFRPVSIEQRLYHDKFMYAGKLDRIGPLNGGDVLIDLKSGAKVPVDELQAAAYWELCRSNKIPVKKQFDLYLHANSTYRLEPIEKPKLLLPVFLACLTVTRWKEKL